MMKQKLQLTLNQNISKSKLQTMELSTRSTTQYV